MAFGKLGSLGTGFGREGARGRGSAPPSADLPDPPSGRVYLLGADGAYLKGADGAYLLGAA